MINERGREDLRTVGERTGMAFADLLGHQVEVQCCGTLSDEELLDNGHGLFQARENEPFLIHRRGEQLIGFFRANLSREGKVR